MNGSVLGIEVTSISATQTVRPYSSINYLKRYGARYDYREICYLHFFIPAFTLGIYFHRHHDAGLGTATVYNGYEL